MNCIELKKKIAQIHYELPRNNSALKVWKHEWICRLKFVCL